MTILGLTRELSLDRKLAFRPFLLDGTLWSLVFPIQGGDDPILLYCITHYNNAA